MNPAATFLPAALVIILLSAHASAAPVLDTHGDPVHPGVQYHILPAVATHHGYGGGLTLDRSTHRSKADCHLGVFQDGNPSSPGLPVIFSPANGDVSGPDGIPTAGEVNIHFAASSICTQSTVWKLGRFDQGANKWFVLTGGELASHGHPSPSQNLFKIVKVVQRNHEIVFKIVFCPSVCKGCHGLCKDVGIFVDPKTGNRRLALVNHGPFLVRFKRA